MLNKILFESEYYCFFWFYSMSSEQPHKSHTAFAPYPTYWKQKCVHFLFWMVYCGIWDIPTLKKITTRIGFKFVNTIHGCTSVWNTSDVWPLACNPMKRSEHPQGDTDKPELSYRHHGKIMMLRNRHPGAIYFTTVCKECFVFVKSDCHYPFQLICKPCGPNMTNVGCLYTEKFALEVAYRETRPPFWDALVSRYWRPMTNVRCMIPVENQYCRLQILLH